MAGVSLQRRRGARIRVRPVMAPAEVVGQQRSPAGGEADAAVEILMLAKNLFEVDAVGGDEAFAALVVDRIYRGTGFETTIFCPIEQEYGCSSECPPTTR